MAVRAYILVETEMGKTRPVARTLLLDKNVLYADIVTGPFDVVVVLEASDLREVGEIVFSGIHAIPGIIRTTTCLAVPS